MHRRFVLILAMIFFTHFLFADTDAHKILEPYLPMVKIASRYYHRDSEKDTELVDLVNALQIYIASCGKYSKEEYEEHTGKELDHEPGNYFTSYYLDDSQMDQCFDGVCHDYATRMFDFINKNPDIFYEAGMGFTRPDPELLPSLKYPRFWYVSSDPEKPGVIEREASNWLDRDDEMRLFRFYSQKNVTPHRDSNGKPASNHAWIWVQHSDSTCYWFDPTWTDNTGNLRWGYVDFEKKEEVQIGSIVDWYGFDREEKEKRNAQYAESKKKEEKKAARENAKKRQQKKSNGFNPDLVFSLGYSIAQFDFNNFGSSKLFSPDRLGLSFAVESPAKKVSPLWIGTLDYYRTWGDGQIQNSFIAGGGIGYSADRYVGIYAGGGLGIRFGEFDRIADSIDFAWKVNGGFRLCWSQSRYNIRFDLSYGTIIGPSMTCYLGWRF
ncbi:MAG: hypothetical protein IKQ66_05630 [Treponema sp.]|nr:hypothetical protein [Treponema sp.]